MSRQISDNPFCRSRRFAGKRVHLGVTGSIACYKSADLLRALLNIGITVSATLSACAREFITPMLIRALGAEPVYSDMFARDTVFGHLAPGRTADCLLVAPASADMLAKMANGLADDMLSAQFLAFEGNCAIAPAMNPRMWRSPATVANVETLTKRGVVIIPPGIGKTACGEEGQGRLADLPQIYLTCLKMLSTQDLRGFKTLITMGPTREPWDSVRFWSNPSSGLMGTALATAAWLRGAEVTALCGPGVDYFLPDDIDCLKVTSAKEMFAKARQLWPQMNLGIFCAAVSDFAPERPAEPSNKISKADLGEKFLLEFRRNPDILATLSNERSNDQKILGFAAETGSDLEALVPLAKIKLVRKNADIIAANMVNGATCAFGAIETGMAIVDKNGTQEVWPSQPKADIAWDLLTWLLKI